MSTIRTVQRSMASGELDPRLGGLADIEQYINGLRSFKDGILSEYGTALRRWGSQHVRLALGSSSRIDKLDISGVGVFAIECDINDVRIHDVSDRSIDTTLTSVVHLTVAELGQAYPLAFGNKLILFHPTAPALVVERGADGTWTAGKLFDQNGWYSPNLEGRGNGVSLLDDNTNLTSSEDFFDESDQGAWWFINGGWLKTNKLIDKKKMTVTRRSGLAVSANVAHFHWSGPWFLLATTLTGDLTQGASINDAGDTSFTSDVAEFTQAMTGYIIGLDGTNSSVLIRKVDSATVTQCRAIDDNATTMVGPWTGGPHDLYELRPKLTDGNYLMLEDDSGSGQQLYSRDPLFDAAMATPSDNERKAHFRIGSGAVVRVTAVTDANRATVTIEIPVTQSSIQTPAGRQLAAFSEYAPLMSDFEGWASCGADHQGRLYVGVRTRVIGSRTFQPFNFRPGPNDDDAFVVDVAKAHGTIGWMASGQDLLVGMTGAEYAGRGQPMTPSDFRFDLQTTYGGFPSRPVLIGGAALFTTRCGCGIREMAFRFDTDRYAAPDLTDLNSSLFGILPVTNTRYRDLTVTYEPQPMLLAVDTGQIRSLSLRRENGVAGWSPWRTAGTDFIVSITSVPASAGRDEVWMIVQRFTDSPATAEFHLEVLTDVAPFDNEITIASPGSTTITGLGHLNERVVEVLADGIFLGTYTVSSDQVDLSNHLGSPPASVTIGLPIVCEVEPQVIQRDEQIGPTDLRKRRVEDVRVRMIGTNGGLIGKSDGPAVADKMWPLFPIVEGTTPLATVFSEIVHRSVNAGGEEPRVILRSKGPWPFEVGAISMGVDIGD